MDDFSVLNNSATYAQSADTQCTNLSTMLVSLSKKTGLKIMLTAELARRFGLLWSTQPSPSKIGKTLVNCFLIRVINKTTLKTISTTTLWITVFLPLNSFCYDQNDGLGKALEVLWVKRGAFWQQEQVGDLHPKCRQEHPQVYQQALSHELCSRVHENQAFSGIFACD